MSEANVKKERQQFHYIYKIHFLRGYPTGRYYIGKRSYFGPDIESDKYTGSGNFCEAYFKKYGTVLGDTYLKEIIEINPSFEINHEREGFHIGDLWKTDPLCMNQCPGGKGVNDYEFSVDSQDKAKKDINQYALDGTYIKTWHGIREAARELGINRSGIQSCLSGKKPSAFGYQWKYNTGDTNNIEAHYSINPVDQYDQSGNLINTFTSPCEAEKTINVDAGSIVDVCNGKRVRAGGFIWRYSGEPFNKYRTENKKSSRVYTRKERKIQQLTPQRTLIKVWFNVHEAATALNIVESSIYCAANGTRNTAGGYAWKWDS